MKAKIGLLGISVLTAAVSISPFALAQEGPYGRPPVSTASASTKGNSAEAAREDATSKVKEGDDYRKARAKLKDSILTAKANAALGKYELIEDALAASLSVKKRRRGDRRAPPVAAKVM